jgi:hypothetical protein
MALLLLVSSQLACEMLSEVSQVSKVLGCHNIKSKRRISKSTHEKPIVLCPPHGRPTFIKRSTTGFLRFRYWEDLRPTHFDESWSDRVEGPESNRDYWLSDIWFTELYARPQPSGWVGSKVIQRIHWKFAWQKLSRHNWCCFNFQNHVDQIEYFLFYVCPDPGWTLYNVQCTMYNVQCVMYNVQHCTLGQVKKFKSWISINGHP